jgi:hypothetical protein
VLLLGDGCSWAFVRNPTSEELASRRPPECTRSDAAPVVDTVFAAGFLTLGVVALADHPRCVASHEWFCDLDYDVAIAAGLIAIPFIISGIHGYSATAECRELERGYAGCLTGVERSCRSPSPVGSATRFALAADPDR